MRIIVETTIYALTQCGSASLAKLLKQRGRFLFLLSAAHEDQRKEDPVPPPPPPPTLSCTSVHETFVKLQWEVMIAFRDTGTHACGHDHII